jgi:transcriptional regulator GlxA family with amidase domain
MAGAAELLSQRAIPVREVAQQVGYRQASHFAQIFRWRYGVSPTSLRTHILSS